MKTNKDKISIWKYRTFADVKPLLTDKQNDYIERELHGYGLVKFRFDIRNKRLVRTIRLIKDRLSLTIIISKKEVIVQHRINNKLTPML